MKTAKKTERINIRTTKELKAFVTYLAERYRTDETEIIENAIYENYPMQYSTFKSTIEWDTEKED
jgi:predicted transcriptional regulator